MERKELLEDERLPDYVGNSERKQYERYFG